jgi:hypothetical protein
MIENHYHINKIVYSEIFLRTTHELEFFLCRAKCEIFFHNLTLGYMTNTLNQIIFFSSTNKSDRHDITEILLNVALNTIKQTSNINNRRNTNFQTLIHLHTINTKLVWRICLKVCISSVVNVACLFDGV